MAKELPVLEAAISTHGSSNALETNTIELEHEVARRFDSVAANLGK